MLKKIVWNEDSVFSLQLREDLFTLVQMRRNHLMQFFVVRNSTNEWAGTDLNAEYSLFYIFVAENRLKSLFVEKIETSLVTPSREPIPTLMLSAVIGNAGVHGAQLIELTPDYSSYGGRVVKDGLTVEHDLDLIYRHELCGMYGDPEKIRNRLLRYFDTGVNWDESKAFLFKGIQPPPHDFVKREIRAGNNT